MNFASVNLEGLPHDECIPGPVGIGLGRITPLQESGVRSALDDALFVRFPGCAPFGVGFIRRLGADGKENQNPPALSSSFYRLVWFS